MINRMKWRTIVCCVLMSTGCALHAMAQKWAERMTSGVNYHVEMQASLSEGNTPLWLNANRYGLSSLQSANGYLMVGVERPVQADSARKWAWGYGADVAVAHHYTSAVVVQQCYATLRWLKGEVTVGSKEYPMELKNQQLSSGGQTFGVNARPVPQVRIALPDYWAVPLLGDWVHIKGFVAYGMFTDQRWQHEFTNKEDKYVDGALYHAKAGYLKIGKEDGKHPLSVELGIEMACVFGGTSYLKGADGTMKKIENSSGLRDFWNAFIPSGGEQVETTYRNAEGNQLGSWLIRVNYDAPSWKLGVYADKYFEDHSSMFQLDYNGYGTGNEWNVKKDHRYFLYDFRDIMLGAELQLKHGTWLKNVVMEYVYSKYQSGPVYHDHTPSLKDHISGRDEFYNHYIYTGWQHWGQVMGNPLYRSPIYNTNGEINVQNNRMKAVHVGLAGAVNSQLSYRLLGSWQEGFGTYKKPYPQPRYNRSVMVEADYRFASRSMRGWGVRVAWGLDSGHLIGHHCGAQITVWKNGILSK